MTRPLSARQAWVLALQNAINQDQPLPLPPHSPPMAVSVRREWQDYVKQAITRDIVKTPAEWLQEREAAAAARQSPNDHWSALATARTEAAQATDD
jgi:hypothetical protein